MSSELRLKKLRGSGGYVMATINDEQQMKGNLGGPDLFLAPIGRLDSEIITKHFCNTCEKEVEGSPKIEYENPNEEVAENLILAEKGQYICNTCNSTIAEYREFKKQDEIQDIGAAKPLETETQISPEPTIQEQPQTTPDIQPQVSTQNTSQVEATEPTPVGSVSSIEGLAVYDENAKKIGKAKQVGIDSNQTMVLLVTKNDGTEGSVPWSSIGKVGDIILLGKVIAPEVNQIGKCSSCGFVNNEVSKFCEECGTKLQ
ncbi:MAG: PRC-barrel domain-containing protein [Nitrosopumilus sp.]|nr:PRC-barrel domain-containing protein [Nitrosopumilus sp.]MDH3824283.1 PRC-barrel domain-containing protein [Nitrosopumilus sp.]